MRFALAIVLGLAGPAAALQLQLAPNARETASRNSVSDSYAAPKAPFANGTLPVIEIEGEVRRVAYRIASPGLTPLQVMAPVRAQLEAAGYVVRLDCADRDCGGFDFRFAVETLPAPGMYVNLRAFRFVTATKGPEEKPDEVVTLLASTAATVAHLQIVRAGRLPDADVTVSAPAPAKEAPAATPAPAKPSTSNGTLAARLLRDGSVVLDEVEFSTGTDDLGPGSVDQLAALAALLRAQPELRIALVGHTDSVGSHAANLALSRRRAASVRARLIATYEIPAGQVEADGVGYLSPVASNLTPEGRDANRRVEAVVISQ